MKAMALAPPKPLTGLGFRRAVRSARVPREADSPVISSLFTALSGLLGSMRSMCPSF